MSQLTSEDIDRLFGRWQRDGDSRAREALVEHYLPVAHKLAGRYRTGSEADADLRQVAAFGLLKAIDRYEATPENSFVAYLVPTVLGELRRYFRDTGWAVRVPRELKELALKVQHAQRELEAERSSVTAAMIAEHTGLTLEQVSDALAASGAHHAVPFDAPDDDDEAARGPSSSFGADDPAYRNAEFGVDIARASRGLDERERAVLKLRFERDLSQSEMARELGISQMHVSRILRKALERLNDEMGG